MSTYTLVPCGITGGMNNTNSSNNTNGGYNTSGGHVQTGGIGSPVTSPTCTRNCIDSDPHVTDLLKIVKITKVKAELRRLKFDMGFSAKEDGKRFIYAGNNINNPLTYQDNNFTHIPPKKRKTKTLKFHSLQPNKLNSHP